MKSTRAQVMTAARAAMGVDEDDPVFTNTSLQPHFANAFRRLYRYMTLCENPYVETEAYYNLPANTMVLDPATAGMTNVGEIEWLEERGIGGSVAVSNVTLSSGVATVTTSGAHGRSTGNTVVLYGITGVVGANGMFTVNAAGGTSLLLNGSVCTGTYVSGGTVSWSDEQFSPPLEQIDHMEIVPGGESQAPPIQKYQWRGDKFIFYPCNEDRQLRITYTLSGDPPTTDSDVVGIDDAVDALATLTAGLALRAKGNNSLSKELIADAVGVTFARTGEIGGMFHELLSQAVRAMQNERWRRPPFRRPRSTGPSQIVPFL